MSPLIAVGNNPVALAETPDQKKLYAVNEGDGTVSSIDLVDRTVVQTIATGATPVWAVARSDSARVYVLNSGSGTLSAIDTASDAVLSNVPVGAGANFMTYDGKLNRLYVTNPSCQHHDRPEHRGGSANSSVHRAGGCQPDYRGGAAGWYAGLRSECFVGWRDRDFAGHSGEHVGRKRANRHPAEFGAGSLRRGALRAIYWRGRRQLESVRGQL